MYDSVYFYISFLLADLGMTSHPLEQEIGEQGDGSGIDNLKTLHLGCIPVFAAVREKNVSVCGV